MSRNISDAMATILSSNIRPKCEPIITATQTNADGTVTELTWQAKDIKIFTYKCGVDPAGRTLPYIELSWTEICSDSSDPAAKKILNSSKYMAVELSLNQNLGFYNNWSTLYNNELTWQEPYTQDTTWKKLKNEVIGEVIKMPTLFLENKPTVEKSTITWVAKDFLSFLDKPISKIINSSNGLPFFKQVTDALEENKKEFKSYVDISKCIDASIANLQDKHLNFHPNLVLNKSISVSSDTKNFLKNYASLESVYWRFIDDGSIFYDYFEYWDLPYTFKTSYYKKTMFDVPVLEKNLGVSNYQFKYYKFDDSGNWVSTDDSYSVSDVGKGEILIEDNPINPYSTSNYPYVVEKRRDFLAEYFRSDAVVLEFEALPNFEYEVGDIVKIQSNNFYVGGEPIMYEAILVASELSYNGSFREKIIAHEINPAVG